MTVSNKPRRRSENFGKKYYKAIGINNQASSVQNVCGACFVYHFHAIKVLFFIVFNILSKCRSAQMHSLLRKEHVRSLS